jgi:hypothetical protein
VPFRELAFALVSIASSQAKFLSFPAQRCDPLACWIIASRATSRSYVDGLMESGLAITLPLLEFGSMSRRPGDPPGASRTGTIYWLKGALASLTLVVDGEAITSAMTWGMEQRADFQTIVLSLFE